MKICDIRTTTVSVSLPFRIFDAVDLYPHLRDLTDEPVLDESICRILTLSSAPQGS